MQDGRWGRGHAKRKAETGTDERHKIALKTKETARLKNLKTAGWNVLDNTLPAPPSPITPPLPQPTPLTKQQTKEAEDLVLSVRIQKRKDWWMSSVSEDQRLSCASRRLLDLFMRASNATMCDVDVIMDCIKQFEGHTWFDGAKATEEDFARICKIQYNSDYYLKWLFRVGDSVVKNTTLEPPPWMSSAATSVSIPSEVETEMGEKNEQVTTRVGKRKRKPKLTAADDEGKDEEAVEAKQEVSAPKKKRKT